MLPPRHYQSRITFFPSRPERNDILVVFRCWDFCLPFVFASGLVEDIPSGENNK